MKIAVIGTGIAGNYAAWKLASEHDITVFEADSRIGGHTNTVDVVMDGRRYAVDTGFIVFNEWTYPNFIAMLETLGVRWRDSDMSFSVQHHRSGLEYKGSTLNSLFAQRRNLLRPSFHRMIRDILRFNRAAPALLQDDAPDSTLAEYLEAGGYSREFVEYFIVPMGAAIWSSSTSHMQRMPARFFVRFFQNHGMLSVSDRPVWKTIQGGSRQYVRKLVRGHLDRVRLNCPVRQIWRTPDGVRIKAGGSEPEHFDAVFIACHSDQALDMLGDPTAAEREVLGSIRYQRNEAILHTDATLMPRRPLAWAAWNAHVLDKPHAPVAVTYNMNILQGLQAPEQFLVTLNHGKHIEYGRIIQRINYSHPVFTPEAVAAQSRHAELNGHAGTFYCGAYWRYGFHEDGVVSAMRALDHFREYQQHAQRPLRRTG